MRQQIVPYAVKAAIVSALIFTLSSGKSFAQSTLRFAAIGPATTYLLPYFVAQKNGYFPHLNIQELFVNGDANALRALLSKEADIIFLGAAGTLLGVEQGATIKAISSPQPIQDYNLITAPQGPANLTDFTGKVFATTGPGNIPDVLSRLLFRKHKVDVSGIDFIAVSGGHSGMFSAVASGRAAGALVNTITAEQGVQGGQIKVLLRVAQELPDFGYAFTVTRDDVINDPKLTPQIETFVRGLIQGSRYAMQNPNDSADILHERMPDVDIKLLQKVIRQLDDSRVWGGNGGIERETVVNVVSTYYQAGLLKSEVPVDKAFDYRFVNEALKTLGKY
jgi:ABC-type nitrate/sulfonate/bicarbonate transport system substrate-binding protein